MAIESFDHPDDAVIAAKELFWRQGYVDTSIGQLVEATGMNRYAIYNAYGGKLELFLAALDAYYHERKSLFMTVLSEPDRSPLDAIREVSEYCIRQMSDRSAGCLMCNVAQEVGQYEEIVAERVQDYLIDVRNAKELALAQAAEQSELNPAITPAEGARLLIFNMLGSGVMTRNGASREEILANFNTCMALLSAPGQTSAINARRRKKASSTV